MNSAASGGLLAGLATIFLPLAQVLPQHVATVTQEVSTVSGIALIAITILGRFWHHAKLASAPVLAAATAPTPVDDRLANIEKSLVALENRVNSARD